MLYNSLKESIDKFPQKVALICDEREVTYSEFEQIINELSSALIANRVTEGSRICVCFDNGIDYAALYFAVAKVKAVLVSIPPQFSLDEITRIVDFVNPDYFISSSSYYHKIYNITHKNPSESKKSVPHLLEYTDLLKSLSGCSRPETDSCAYEGPFRLMLTSGSTGTPKLVAFSQKNFNYDMKNWIQYLNWQPTDVALCTHSFDNGHGTDIHLFPSLLAGGTLVIGQPNQRQEVTLEQFENYRVTIFSGLPIQYHCFNQISHPNRYNISSLRLCLSGGAPLSKRIVQRFNEIYGLNIKRIYGATELGVMLGNLSDEIQTDGGMLPVANVLVRIVDDHGNPVNQGEIGEVIAHFQGSSLGYYNNPEATNRVFKDGWYYTNDLSYQDPSGYFYVLGRKVDAVNINGNWVFPAEVEAALEEHQNVIESVAVTITKNGTQKLFAFVVTNASVSVASLLSFCKANLAHYKVPETIYTVDSIPKIPNGKPDKKLLQNIAECEN